MARTFSNLIPYKNIQTGGSSDHYWFQKHGFITLSISEENPRDNPNYHTTSDEYSTLAIPFEVEIVKAGLATIANLIGITVGVEDDNLNIGVPNKFVLYQNSPNPFNPKTAIRFDSPKTSHVVLKIYNHLGQEIRKLVEG